MIFRFSDSMSDLAVKNELKQLPTCVGFIMDGNRRWAKEQGLESLSGHKAGEEKFYEVAQWVKEQKIANAVFYAFSTENWSRSFIEVTYLQAMFLEFTKRMLLEVDDWQVRIRVFGNLLNFSQELKNSIHDLETNSAKYKKTTIWVALSYGGRAEIIEAIRAIIKEGRDVTEEEFSNYLWSAGMPDPDLIIRTGGEMRLSNFLPWQSVYSELIFTDTYWPAFTKTEFISMLDEYAKRQRRHGK